MKNKISALKTRAVKLLSNIRNKVLKAFSWIKADKKRLVPAIVLVIILLGGSAFGLTQLLDSSPKPDDGNPVTDVSGPTESNKAPAPDSPETNRTESKPNTNSSPKPTSPTGRTYPSGPGPCDDLAETTCKIQLAESQNIQLSMSSSGNSKYVVGTVSCTPVGDCEVYSDREYGVFNDLPNSDTSSGFSFTTRPNVAVTLKAPQAFTYDNATNKKKIKMQFKSWQSYYMAPVQTRAGWSATTIHIYTTYTQICSYDYDQPPCD